MPIPPHTTHPLDYSEISTSPIYRGTDDQRQTPLQQLTNLSIHRQWLTVAEAQLVVVDSDPVETVAATVDVDVDDEARGGVGQKTRAKNGNQ